MERCGSCKYRIYIYGGKSHDRDGHRVACGYILANHKMRGCDPKHCDKYEEGKPVRMTNPMRYL